jgi:hypothetical protein
MTMDREITLLVALIDEAYDTRSWHGTNLRGSLRGLTSIEAARRPSPRRHNIWENVVHAAYWKYAVRRRLLKEKRGSFPLEGSNWFRRPEHHSAAAWKEDVALLDQEHRALRDAVVHLRAKDLRRRVGRSKGVTAGFILRGIAAHDLYHAGQIQLLKRFLRSSYRHQK